MTVIFDLISNCRHAAQARHGFLRILSLDEVLPNSGRHHAASVGCANRICLRTNCLLQNGAQT